MMKRAVLVAGLALALSACQEGQYAGGTKHLSPISPATLAAMTSKGMSKEAPILIRSFKMESELEVWKRAGDGRYALLKTFPICRWSGQLGPKVREGDRQAPEGFYTITPAQMNPNSSYYLSFDTGFPNAYDRAHGRSGSHLMVHGSCSSRGCFAMTDEAIAEVYAIGREAFAGGQRSFQFQSFPFRMTAENLAKYRHDPHMPFWLNLKEGSDYFEVTKGEPAWSVIDGRYAFNSGDDPSTATAVLAKQVQDEREVAALVAEGMPATTTVYEDGDGHPSFR
jgi:murein L,D-transpeptidase YafK